MFCIICEGGCCPKVPCSEPFRILNLVNSPFVFVKLKEILILLTLQEYLLRLFFAGLFNIHGGTSDLLIFLVIMLYASF